VVRDLWPASWSRQKYTRPGEKRVIERHPLRLVLDKTRKGTCGKRGDLRRPKGDPKEREAFGVLRGAQCPGELALSGGHALTPLGVYD